MCGSLWVGQLSGLRCGQRLGLCTVGAVGTESGGEVGSVEVGHRDPDLRVVGDAGPAGGSDLPCSSPLRSLGVEQRDVAQQRTGRGAVRRRGRQRGRGVGHLGDGDPGTTSTAPTTAAIRSRRSNTHSIQIRQVD